MKITEIKNQKLRSLLENSSDDYIEFNVSPKQLLDLGWVFDNSIEYYIENENLTRKEAEKQFDKDCIIYLEIRKLEDEEITTTYEINTMKDHLSNVSNGYSEWSGSDEQTIIDIETLGLF